MMKSTVLSKTIWVNLLTLLAALFAMPELTAWIDPQMALIIVAVINLVLRQFFTTQPLRLPGA